MGGNHWHITWWGSPNLPRNMCPNQPRWCKPFCNAIIFFTWQKIDSKLHQIRVYAIHITSSLGPTVMRLVTSVPAQFKLLTRRQESTFVVKKLIFGDYSLTKRASIMRVGPVKAVVTCFPKTSLVSQSGDSFSTERHCPNQNVSQPTPVSPNFSILNSFFRK